MDLATRPQLVSTEHDHLRVGQRTVLVVVLGAIFPDVKQRREIEVRHQAPVELIDVAEEGLVGGAERRILNQQLDIGLIFVGARRDAEDGVVEAAAGVPETQDVVVSGTEMEDGLTRDLLLLEIVTEMDVAGALLLVEAPGGVPVVEHSADPSGGFVGSDVNGGGSAVRRHLDQLVVQTCRRHRLAERHDGGGRQAAAQSTHEFDLRRLVER